MNIECFYCDDLHAIEDCCEPEKIERVIESLKTKVANMEASIPYGYRLENERITPNEAEQRIIQLAKKYRAKGLSLEQIAKVLAGVGARKSMQTDTAQPSH